MPGSDVPSHSMSAGSNALPRWRTLGTNSKQPKYSGSFSCAMPRWGRSQLRKSDQHPALVGTWTAHQPLTATLPHPQDGRAVLRPGATTSLALEPASTSLAFLALAHLWLSCVARNH